MDTERNCRIVAEARTWIGTPYHHKGRVKNVGVDCGGFIHCVYSQFFDIPPFPDYYPEDWALHDTNPEYYLDYIAPYTREVSAPAMAGLAVFKFGRKFAHGTICSGQRTFIHAYGRTKFGSVKEDRIGFFRYPDGRPREVRFFALRY